MAAAAVLGMQPLRTPLLDDVHFSSGNQTSRAAASNTRRHDCGAHRSGSGGLGTESVAVIPASFLLFADDDDDPEDEENGDEDAEVDEDEGDDDDEEVWQVRLTCRG